MNFILNIRVGVIQNVDHGILRKQFGPVYHNISRVLFKLYYWTKWVKLLLCIQIHMWDKYKIMCFTESFHAEKKIISIHNSSQGFRSSTHFLGMFLFYFIFSFQTNCIPSFNGAEMFKQLTWLQTIWGEANTKATSKSDWSSKWKKKKNKNVKEIIKRNRRKHFSELMK